MKKLMNKIFGGLKITWPKLIIFAVVMGIYTALMAMLVPDGNSFHDIAVTLEWWVLPAILIIYNSKKPLDAALKTFIFFLISQPLVYLIQVPFNEMGWGLFGYYRYWFIITLLTFPGAYVGWFIKKDKWYSGVILSAMTVLLVIIGVDYVKGFSSNFPNHFLSACYCFAIIPVLIVGIFKDKIPRFVTLGITIVAIIASLILPSGSEMFEVYDNTTINSVYELTFTGTPRVENFSGTKSGSAEIRYVKDMGYVLKLRGVKGGEYSFMIVDESDEYPFKYHFDDEQQTVVVKMGG